MRTVIETAEAVRRGELKASEVLDECLAAIEARNGELNAFVHLQPDLARAAAEAVDAAVARGDDPGPLAGVPFGVKDLEDCAGMPTSFGSLLYKGRPPVASDSVHVARLRAAGAVPVGKTAAPEFGSTCFTSTKAWGTTRNPWNPELTPGGSSGGSGAAVAAGLTPFCTASDGGGSTRIPASFCGLVGFKATHGRIPNPHFAESDTVVLGALTTTVSDAARHLDVASGPTERDRTSLPALPASFSYESVIDSLRVQGLRAAWTDTMGYALCDPEVAEVSRAAAEQLADEAGLELVEVPVDFSQAMRVWLSITVVEIWQDLERDMWPERADDLERMMQRAFQATADFPVSKYAEIVKRRHTLQDDVAAVFDQVDVVLSPTTAVTAFRAEGPIPTVIAGREVAPGMAVPFTMPANLCGQPAVSVPAGVDSGGLPVGLQVMGRRFADDVVLRLARIAEQTRPWTRLAPS